MIFQQHQKGLLWSNGLKHQSDNLNTDIQQRSIFLTFFFLGGGGGGGGGGCNSNCLFCCFTSQATAMVMGGRSVHLTTLFPRQA